MTNDEIYKKLDSDLSQHEKERLFIAYAKNRVTDLPRDQRQRVAYEIAGLMSTKFAAELPEGSVFEEILGLAGELEMGVEEDKWKIFTQLVFGN